MAESLEALGGARLKNFVPLFVHRFARERLRALGQVEGTIAKTVPEVLFVCVQNAGRSQMAAALLDHYAEGRVHVRSAGSAPADEINPDVVTAMSELGIDVSKEFPKPMTDEVVQAADAVITMGCGDACPIYPGKRYEDWEVDDPAEADLDGVRRIRDDIGDRVRTLLAEVTAPAASSLTAAVITDIHGNLPALQAALERIDELGISRVFCGGDLVGYGPRPNEVCALIAERQIPTIYGNYDYAIARDLEDCGCAYVDQHDRELGQQSVAWTLEHTDQAAKDFMRELPFDLRFELGGRRIHLVHGSPRKVNEYLFEDKPARLYERLAGAEHADVLVFGHTHKPWIREFAGVLFVNCGSVGKPKDGDPRGAFAVLDLDDAGQVHARIERVAYDVEPVAREVVAAGLPAEYADKLLAAA